MRRRTQLGQCAIRTRSWHCDAALSTIAQPRERSRALCYPTNGCKPCRNGGSLAVNFRAKVCTAMHCLGRARASMLDPQPTRSDRTQEDKGAQPVSQYRRDPITCITRAEEAHHRPVKHRRSIVHAIWRVSSPRCTARNVSRTVDCAHGRRNLSENATAVRDTSAHHKQLTPRLAAAAHSVHWAFGLHNDRTARTPSHNCT